MVCRSHMEARGKPQAGEGTISLRIFLLRGARPTPCTTGVGWSCGARPAEEEKMRKIARGGSNARELGGKIWQRKKQCGPERPPEKNECWIFLETRLFSSRLRPPPEARVQTACKAQLGKYKEGAARAALKGSVRPGKGRRTRSSESIKRAPHAQR